MSDETMGEIHRLLTSFFNLPTNERRRLAATMQSRMSGEDPDIASILDQVSQALIQSANAADGVMKETHGPAA